MSGLTVLYAPNVCAAKGNGAIRLGYQLRHDVIAVDSFVALVTALESLKDIPTAYVVRGCPKEDAPHLIRRRAKREPFHLEDTPQQWLCVDIDDRPIAINCFKESDRAIDSIRASLPGGLPEAACYYALTASCERHKLSAHLWFWLDRPYSNRELLKELGGRCDTSLYRPTQPHFTALPKMKEDPIAGRRRGALMGEVGWVGQSPEQADPVAAERQLQAAMNDIAAQKKGQSPSDYQSPRLLHGEACN